MGEEQRVRPTDSHVPLALRLRCCIVDFCQHTDQDTRGEQGAEPVKQRQCPCSYPSNALSLPPGRLAGLRMFGPELQLIVADKEEESKALADYVKT